jgi:hypothetical protein
MKLIELYLEEIRHRLPPRNREDILREIHSVLMDTLEDRNSNPGQAPDEETIKSVLKAFGSPRKIARQYGAQNYLIGPRFFPLYILVLKVVLIVITALHVLGVSVIFISQSGFGTGVWETISTILGGVLNTLFTGFGIVTLAFACIERTTPEDWGVDFEKDWQPEDLYKEENQERIKLAELAVGITMNLILIAALNFFLDRIGIYYLSDSGWVSTPILNENFKPFIPWITAYAIMDITLSIYLIRKEYWDKTGSIAQIFINVFKIAVISAIISSPGIITIDPTTWQQLFPNAELTAQGLTHTANLVLEILMGIAIFGLSVDSIKRLYLTFIKGRHTVIEINKD